VHDPDVPVAVNVQVTAVPELGVAVRITVAPLVRPEAISKVGELSDVWLSVELLPKSEEEFKSGVTGAAGRVEYSYT
jgi:hypothetical protein